MKSKQFKINSPKSNEEVKFLQFQNRVYDLQQDDGTMKRYLRSTNFNLSKAEEMLRNSVKWRAENKVDSFLTWKPPALVAKDFVFNFIGTDLDGHSVVYLPIGCWEMKKIMQVGYKEETLQFRFHVLEKIMESVKKTAKSKFVMIMDMKGLTYKKCVHFDTVQFLAIAFQDFEKHYPERLRACYVINAPWAFSYIYGLLKHVLSSKTLNKAKIFDEDICKWKSFLIDRIPEDTLKSVLQ